MCKALVAVVDKGTIAGSFRTVSITNENIGKFPVNKNTDLENALFRIDTLVVKANFQ